MTLIDVMKNAISTHSESSVHEDREHLIWSRHL